MPKPKLLLLYTGGTIGMVKNFETGALKVFNFKKLLQNIPELKQLDCDIETFSFDRPIDSSDMDSDKWRKMAIVIEANYDNFDGFVILHGSDTMAYSASALSGALSRSSILPGFANDWITLTTVGWGLTPAFGIPWAGLSSPPNSTFSPGLRR